MLICGTLKVALVLGVFGLGLWLLGLVRFHGSPFGALIVFSFALLGGKDGRRLHLRISLRLLSFLLLDLVRCLVEV